MTIKGFDETHATALIDGLIRDGTIEEPVLAVRWHMIKTMIDYAHGGEATPFPILNTAVEGLDDGLDETGETLDSDEAGLFNGAIGRMGTKFAQSLEGVGGAFGRALRQVFGPIADVMSGTGSDKIKEENKRNFRKLANMGLIDEAAIEKLDEVLQMEGIGANLVPIVSVFAVIMGSLKVIFNTAGGDFAKKMLSVFTPNGPTAEHAIRAAFLGNAPKAQVAKKLAELGYNNEDIEFMIGASMQTLPVDMIIQLWLRDELSDSRSDSLLYKLGFSKYNAAQVKKATKYMPGINEIFRLMRREAFEPDIISYYGYDDDFPDSALPYAKAQGMDEDMARKFWYAGWNTPTIGQGYEMLHRGKLTLKELDDLFKTVEIPPFWRDRLKEISFHPYTRVDVRRMYKAGVLTPKEVKRSYLDLGYDDEKANKMSQWTMAEQLEEDRSLTRSQVLAYYKDDLLSPAEIEGYLEGLGYDQESRDLMIAAIDFDKAVIEERDKMALIGELYVSQRVGYDKTKADLFALEIPTTKIDKLMTQWSVDIESQKKFPPKNDLDKMVKAGAISVDQYKIQLEKIGYSQEYIKMYVSLLEKTNERLYYEINGKLPNPPTSDYAKAVEQRNIRNAKGN